MSRLPGCRISARIRCRSRTSAALVCQSKAGLGGHAATNLSNGTTFVVASDELDPVGVSELEACQKRYCLDAEQSPVDVIAEEQVVGMRRVTANSKDFYQIVELSVQIRLSTFCTSWSVDTHP